MRSMPPNVLEASSPMRPQIFLVQMQRNACRQSAATLPIENKFQVLLV